jgi:[ribosomal protein S18]-alanine N-acetyltransferase
MVTHAPRPLLTDVAVEPMRRRHLRGVLAIEQQVYPRPWSPGLFASELARRDSRRYVVALAADANDSRWRVPGRRRVLGYAGLMLLVDEAHITTVAVHPAHHRRKIATRLLVAVLEEARAMGAQAATLEVRAANLGAQRLYQNFGFAPVGLRPGYYAETGEDALIMWAHDLQSEAMRARLDDQAERFGAPGGASGAPDLHVPWVQGRVGLPEREQPG